MTPNYEKGRRYYWIGKATLACDILGVRPRHIIISTQKPKGPRNRYHRIAIEVIRTERECDALVRKWDKRKAKFARELKKHVAQLDAARAGEGKS